MKVTEHLANATEPLISFEIIPPRRGGDLQSLLTLIEDLAAHRPTFIDITSHAAEVVYDETPEGIRRRVTRKRPGTLGICALIQNKLGIDAVPHVLCEGFSREETEDFLIELRYLGIDNVLAVRGDSTGRDKPLGSRTRNEYASDLIAQIAAMNHGHYLEDVVEPHPTDFCIGAAGYPEKHFESPNLKADIAHVKEKVEAGAEYIVTQMFFDNALYYRFVDECRAQGIDVPIIPGLRILSTERQLTSIPKTFHCDIPEALAHEMSANPHRTKEIGVAWATDQVRDLLANNVPSIHFFVMSSSVAVDAALIDLGL